MKNKGSVKVEYLSDNMIQVDTIATWIFNEFIDGIKHDLSYGDILSNIKDCHKQELPVRFAALIGDKCVGTVSLVKNDLSCRNYTPWLSALYVDENFRSQGIGEQLIDTVIDKAQALGYDKIYLRTEFASGYYRKLGWEFVEACEDEGYNFITNIFTFENM